MDGDLNIFFCSVAAVASWYSSGDYYANDKDLNMLKGIFKTSLGIKRPKKGYRNVFRKSVLSERNKTSKNTKQVKSIRLLVVFPKVN